MMIFNRIMKKWVLLFLLIYTTALCSFFKKKSLVTSPGLEFPLAPKNEISFDGEINKALILSQDMVFFSSSKGSLYTINEPGKGLKLIYQSGIDFISPPYIHGEFIFVYDSKNQIYCIHKNGALEWKTSIKEKISSGIQTTSEKIFFGTDKGRFYCFQLDSGECVWEVKTGGAIRSLPVVIQETIIFGCDDHNLYFLSMDGKIKYKHETGGKIRGSLIYEKSYLYFGSYDEFFYCFDRHKKKVKWKVKTGGRVHTYPLIHKKYVFVNSWNNVLFCLNKKNGTVLWWNKIPSRCKYPMEIVGDKILVTSLSSVLNCFDLKTGKDQGKYVAENEVRSNPLWFHDGVMLSVYDKGSDSSQVVFLNNNKE